MGNYFSEKQEVAYPTPAPPLHGRGVAGAQGFSFLAHPVKFIICLITSPFFAVLDVDAVGSGMFYSSALQVINDSRDDFFDTVGCDVADGSWYSWEFALSSHSEFYLTTRKIKEK
ncbi:MAG: hypothetical protein J6Y97_10470 [Prevotella sp.]|nr:hypothetical protein [Prevotella sp.]